MMKQTTRFGVLPLVFASLFLVQGQDSGEHPFDPPVGLTASQSTYGESGTVLLFWSNPVRYEAIDVLVDGELAAVRVDGAAQSAAVTVPTGAHAFAVRGRVGDDVSVDTAIDFTVLADTPVTEPARSIDCGFFPGEGGRLEITFEAGADPWESGEVRLTGGDTLETFESGTTSLDVALPVDVDERVRLEAPAVELVFQNADGYLSEPIALSCPARIPVFRRGDCDSNGAVNISDAIFTLNHLFLGRQRWFCDDACDVDDSGDIGITDPVRILSRLFLGGPPPADPGPSRCGVDPTPDFLGGACSCP